MSGGSIWIGWCVIGAWRPALARNFPRLVCSSRKPDVLLQRGFVHVQALVQLDLQAVALRARVGIGAHQLHALVGVVHLHVVAHAGERGAHELGEARIAGGAVAVAQHDVGARPPFPVVALLARHRAHRVAVDVPHRAEALVRRVEQRAQRRVVGRVEALDAQPHLVGPQPARVDRAAVLQRAPDEALADARLAARHDLAVPLAVDQLRDRCRRRAGSGRGRCAETAPPAAARRARAAAPHSSSTKQSSASRNSASLTTASKSAGKRLPECGESSTSGSSGSRGPRISTTSLIAAPRRSAASGRASSSTLAPQPLRATRAG